MLSRTLNYVLHLIQGSRERGITFEDLDRMDFAYDEDLTIFDQERLLIKEGKVAAITAFLDDDKLMFSGGEIPDEYENEKDALIAVAKCTSFLLIDEGKVEGYPKQQFYGTAFFVSDNLLITAGHNTVGVNGPINRLAITYPGIDQIHPWHVSQKEVPTINCKVVATIYKKNGPPSKDIAILDAGSFCAAKYVQLSSFIPPPKTAVYVIGYPGDIKRGWVETQVGLNNLEEAHENATQLFPKGRLTVSCGEVVTTGNIIEYAVSTCPGMSGACVVYNGMVIGVHIGRADASQQNLPMAVSFSGDEIGRIFSKHRLTVS